MNYMNFIMIIILLVLITMCYFLVRITKYCHSFHKYLKEKEPFYQKEYEYEHERVFY